MSPPSSTPPPAVSESYVFPSGDATSIAGGTAWDIVGLKTTLSSSGAKALKNGYDVLQVDVTFTQDVSNAIPAPGQPLLVDGVINANKIGVSVAIDSDGNASTGNAGVCNSQSPTLKPFEYITDQGDFPSRLPDGNYSILANNVAIYSGPPNPHAEAQFSVKGNVISFTFDLNTLGVFAGPKIPKIGISVASFNGAASNGIALTATDCVPIGSNGVYEVYTTPS